MNMTVPIVASTDRLASGRTPAVHGPPLIMYQSLEMLHRGDGSLTGNYNQIGEMCQPIAGLDALHLLGSANFLGDQTVKLAMRTPKDEFDTGLLA